MTPRRAHHPDASSPARPDRPGVWRLDAAGAFDAHGRSLAPASLLIRVGAVTPGPADSSWARIDLLAVGTPSDIDSHPASAGAQQLALADEVILPGLVNAHTHMDLTHLGPLEHDPAEGFVAWVDRIRAGRRVEDDAIASSVRRGIELVVKAGTVAAGDIAGAPRGVPTLIPWQTLGASPLAGVSYLETFGIGPGEAPAQRALASVLDALTGPPIRAGRVGLGLSPHAPNTVSRSMYRWVGARGQRLGLPICTHLAESPEERRFIAHGDGPQRELLERFGLWDQRVAADLGSGLHPVEHLAEFLAEAAPVLAVHVNDATDRAIELLAAARARVVYCPRASAYFGACEHFGPHRYRDMLDAGITVAIGTDSIVNLPAGAEHSGISVLDELRVLWSRDGGNPSQLLALATTAGARVLGLDPDAFVLAAGKRSAGLVAVDRADHAATLEGVLTSQHPARLLLGGTEYDLAATSIDARAGSPS